jgi:hypothetical protein
MGPACSAIRHRSALVLPGTATILKRAASLMGQRRGIPSSNDTGGLYADAHFLPGVFEMTWNGKNYQAGRRLPLPDDMNLYRFAMWRYFQ